VPIHRDGSDEARSVASDSSLVFVSQLLGNVGFFVAVLVIARGLGPEGRGTIAFIVVSALVLARLGSIGVSEATLIFATQRPALRPQLLSNAVLFASVAGSLVAGVAAGTLFLLDRAAPAGVGTSEVLVLFLGTVAVAIFDATDHFVLGCGRLRQRAAIFATVPWIYALLAATMLSTGTLTVTGAASAWALATGAGALAIVSIAARGIGFGRPQAPLLRESIRFGVRAWIGNIATFLSLRIDQIVLGLLATQATLGIYAVAVNASEILLYFPAAVATALLPALARQDAAARHEQTLRVFRILGLTTVVSMGLAALLGPWLLPRVFGSAFEDSVAAFLWLLPAALGFAVTKVFSSALLASSSPGRSAAGPLISLGVGLSLDLLLIPPYGAAGAAAAASLGFLAGGATALLVYKTRFPFAWESLLPRRDAVALLPWLASHIGSGTRRPERASAPGADLPLRGASIVCLSSIDWDFLWQTHQEIMSRLAAGGNRVVFVENTGGVRSIRLSDAPRLVGRLVRVLRQAVRGDRRPAQDLTIVSPLLLPFARSRISCFINERVILPRLAARIRRIAGPDPVIYSYLPTANALQLTQLIGGARSVVVYHCVADYQQLADDLPRLIEHERQLVRRADLVFVQSAGLAERFATTNRRVHRIPIGVNLGIFDPAAVHDPAPDVRNLSRPILGYIGALHVHVDLELLIRLARAFPNGSLVVVGPVQVDPRGLRELSNVHFLRNRAHAELPAVIRAFDVGLIPYRRSAYTETVNPTKLFEYLAMGCAAVSTDLPEVVSLALPPFALRTAGDHHKFIENVRDAIVENGPEDRARRRALALERDWTHVVRQVAALIAERRDAAHVGASK